MVKIQPYVKLFYDNLKKGDIQGLRCTRCGTFLFPPIAVCQRCGGANLDWEKISGKGRLLDFCVVHSTVPRHQDLTPYIEGIVTLEEGVVFCAPITGLDPLKPEEIFGKIPMDVVAEVKELAGVHVVTFKPITQSSNKGAL